MTKLKKCDSIYTTIIIQEGVVLKSQETPNEKFKRIASARTQKIISMIELLGNCSNNYVYEYSQEEVNKIFNAIETEIRIAKEKFNGNGKSKEKFTL